jgi:hypothetical protein
LKAFFLGFRGSAGAPVDPAAVFALPPREGSPLAVAHVAGS